MALKLPSGGSDIQLLCCPSQVTLDGGHQAGWTKATAACLASVNDEVYTVPRAVL